jgi:hypothetical protein
MAWLQMAWQWMAQWLGDGELDGNVMAMDILTAMQR